MMAQVGHLPFYLADPRVEVVAVAEERPSLQAALRARLGASRVLATHEALLARGDIDAVIISSPRPATGPLTLAALHAGKHVLAEKPMAHTADQARRLVDAAKAAKRIYAVGYMKLFDPGVAAAKAEFDDIRATGRLGRLLAAHVWDHSKSYAAPIPAHVRPTDSRPVRYPTWPTAPDWLAPEHRGTYAWFLNAASHDVSLVTHFFPGPIDVVGATAPSDGAVSALLRCGDVPVSLDVSKTEAGRWLEGAEFHFEHGRLTLAIPSPMAVDKVAEARLDDKARGRVGDPIATGAGWCFARQATAFIDALVAGGPYLASGAAGLVDMDLTEAIWRRIGGHA